MYVNRRKEILNLLQKHGSVKVSELASQFGLNEATIRRDLKFLADRYGVELTYGGAFIDENAGSCSITEMNLAAKRRQAYEEKQMIARKAAELIKDGETIALNAGSTVEYILDYLPSLKQINLITLSLNVAVKAAALPFVTVYMPGGKLRQESTTFYGPDTEQYLRKFNVDKFFYGAAAVHIKHGVTHPVIEEAKANQILLDISKHCYLACDSSKFDGVSLVHIADLAAFHTMITDDKLPAHYKSFAKLNNMSIL